MKFRNLVLLFLFMFLLSACYYTGKATILDQVESDNRSSLTITLPTANYKVGWNFLFTGSCPSGVSSINITSSPSALNTTLPCAGGTWSTYLDVSALPVGAGSIIVSAPSAKTAQISINKITSACDVQSSRQKTWAQGLAGGSGTMSNPYVICTADQLAQLRSASTTSSIILQNEIDFNNLDTNGDNLVNGSDSNYTTGLGWAPFSIAVSNNQPSSSYIDGRDFEIRNLYINRPGSSVGLFSDISYRQIKNFVFKDANVTGASGGVLTRTCTGSSVLNVHITGNVSTTGNSTGGICGYGGAAILRSSFVGDISNPSGIDVGGLIGAAYTPMSIIAESYFSGTITGWKNVGGLAGGFAGTIYRHIINSYSMGTITGQREVGGLVGSYGTVINSYSAANIVQTGAADCCFGGLVGYGGTIYSSFYTGNIQALISTSIGTLCGTGCSVDGTSAYWSGATCSGSGGCTMNGLAIANLSQFYDSTQAPMSAWDYINSSADGTDDHWVSQTNKFPIFWWQEDKAYTAPFSGSGTSASPYLISSTSDFNQIGGNTRWADATFQLNSDLDFLGVIQQIPAGYNSAFLGIFLGNNHMISNFTASTSRSIPIGLFGSVFNSTIQDLSANNIAITGSVFTGAVAGVMFSSTLTHVSSSGTVNASSTNSGGLVGSSYYGKIEKSASSATVNGIDKTGGLVGYSYFTNVDDCYATGSVTGTSSVGGLVGYHGWLYVRRSYATGNVAGTFQVGGLIGGKSGNTGNPTQDSFSTGNVTGNSAASDVGLFIGMISDATSSTGNLAYSSGTCANSGGGGCNVLLYTPTAPLNYFYNPANAPLTSWDFVTIWNNNNPTGFPTLK